MTTIAFDGKILACDSRLVGEHIETVSLQKIRKIKAGYFAYCGSPGEAEMVRKWIEAGRVWEKRPKVEEFSALIVRKYSVHYIDESLEEVPMKAPVAIGTGASIALTAMDCGRNAIEAIRFAIKRDPYTGGRVRHVTV